MEKIKQKVQSLIKGSSSTKSPDSQTILITGASGFIAYHVVEAFLEAGYKVRGTVRAEEKAASVKKLHPKHAHNLSFAIVPDVETKGVFDKAVEGVDGVIHTASPFVMEVENNERDLLQPALQGTKNILESISAHAPQVKRVVITSSFAAIVNMHKGNWPEHTYTEADWNPETYEAAKTADGATAYCASKTFAEKEAFEVVEKEHPNFSIATVCPPMVYGPTEQGVTSTSKLNTSSADIYRLMIGSLQEVPPTAFWAWADVRDVAEAHLLAYESPEAANQRFLVTAGNFSYQMICDVLNQMPELKGKVPVGQTGSGLGADVYGVDAQKSRKVLGLKYRSFDETVKDAARSLLKIEQVEAAA